MNCEINGCENEAKFALFKTNGKGKKEWVNVCPRHEQLIAHNNFEKAGGKITKKTGVGKYE